MMVVVIKNSDTGDERKEAVQSFPVVIGRSSACDITLEDDFVSTKHAEISESNGKLYVKDLGSSNKTFLNGEELTALESHLLNPGDSLEIQSFQLSFADEGKDVPEQPLERETGEAPVSQPISKKEEDALFAIKSKIHGLLLQKIKLKSLDTSKIGDTELRDKVESVTRKIVSELESEIPASIDRELLVKEVMDDTILYGPITDLLRDESISEVMVNGPDHVYIERGGKLQLTDKRFLSDEHIITVMRRILTPIGRRIDEAQPREDGTLPDGSRVHAIIPPLARSGPTLTIRKFMKKKLVAEDLMKFGSANHKMMEVLRLAVKHRANVIVSGGTGSGKTTLLNVLSNFVPEDERIVTIEDTAELKLNQEHIVSLQSRPPNVEGKGEVTIRELVRNALRMRPDRIVVGECRGGETLDMLQAMNTGHDGSLTTVHSNSPRDCLSRLETLVMMAGMDLPERAIREQISAAVNFIVQQSRFSDGSRKITYISEVTGMESGVVTLQDIYLFKREGFDEDGKVLGRFEAEETVPKFFQDLRAMGVEIDMGLFSND